MFFSSNKRLEVIGEAAHDIVNQVHAIQAGSRTADDLILIELEIDIVEFVFGEPRHVFIEKVLVVLANVAPAYPPT